MRIVSMLQPLARDLRFAARRLRHSPAFTAATVLTLAVGLASNAVMFSVSYGVLYRPLPYPGSERLVDVEGRDAKGEWTDVSQPDLDDWRLMTKSFTGLASWVPQSVNLTGGSEPERITGMYVSANFFRLVGVAPVLGRDLTAGEDRIGASRVAIISHRLWQSRFGGDSAVEGRSVQFNGEPYTVIGVLPGAFVFPLADADVYLPSFAYPNYSTDRGQPSCAVLGKLREGVPLKSAQSEMRTVAAALATSYPSTNKGHSAVVTSFRSDLVARRRPAVLILAGSVVFVLLIACANITGLMIARGIARDRERAVRTALGAGRWALVREVLSETVLLCAAGMGLALFAASSAVPLIAAQIAVYLPYGAEIALDKPALVFTAVLALSAALLIAAIPALASSSTDGLRSGRGAGSASAKNSVRTVLVGAELALALVLSVGSGLMLKSFTALARQPAGFEPHNLLTLTYRVPRSKYRTGAQQADFHRRVTDAIGSTPGVVSATSVRAVPLGGNGSFGDFSLASEPEPSPADRPRALLNFVDPYFFSTLRIPVLRGRIFTEHDGATDAIVVVVNQTLAQRYFSGSDPVGQSLRIPNLKQTARVIGVVGDIKHFTLQDPSTPQIYGALAQNPYLFTSLAVRTAGDPLQMADAVRRAVWSIDPDQPVWAVRSMDEILNLQGRLRQIITAMLSGYAAVALILAAIGVFGAISYAVSQRTAEFGVRMALGARGPDVMALVFRQGLMAAGAAIPLGLAGAGWLSRYLRNQLYGVAPLDGATYLAVSALLAVVAVCACLGPAVRASRLDPAYALRSE